MTHEWKKPDMTGAPVDSFELLCDTDEGIQLRIHSRDLGVDPIRGTLVHKGEIIRLGVIPVDPSLPLGRTERSQEMTLAGTETQVSAAQAVMHEVHKQLTT